MGPQRAELQQTILDSFSGYRAADGVVADGSELVGTRGVPYWSVRLERLCGGRQDGVDAVHVDNGRLNLTVLPTRGMGIQEAWYDDLRLGWDSPVGEVVHPSHVNLEARAGLGWLDGFSEYIVRCGLSSNGAPFPGGTLHGRIANRPASAVTLSIGTAPPHTIALHGAVRESCLFHENLLLETTLTTEPGAAWFTVTDRVTNLSAQPGTMQMLYHCNYGPPLLEAGSRLVTPFDWVCPRDAGYGNRNIRGWQRYQGPGAGQVEACYYAGLKANRRGETLQMLRNAAGDLGVVQRYARKALPCFTLWKNESQPEDGYVTGIEPGTNHPNIHPYEKQHRRIVRLGAQKRWQASLTFSIADGRKAVAAVEKEVRSIQGRRKPEVHLAPQPGLSPDGDA